MRECRAAVVLQRAKHRSSIDLVARAIQITASIVAANIVAVRGDCAEIIENTMSSRADVEDRVRHGHDDWSVEVLNLHPIIAHSGIIDDRSDRTVVIVNTGAIVADGTITHYCIRQGRVVHSTSISADSAVSDRDCDGAFTAAILSSSVAIDRTACIACKRAIGYLNRRRAVSAKRAGPPVVVNSVARGIVRYRTVGYFSVALPACIASL